MPSPSSTARPSGTPPFWQPGDVINWRYRRRDHIPGGPELVLPVRVIRDDEPGLAVWVAEATPMWTVERADGRLMREVPLAERFRGERVQGRGSWLGPGVVRVAPTGAPWSVWWFRNADGSHRGWYVNLERPHVRDAGNVFTEDYILDLAVLTPGHSVRKDEDELSAATEAGRYTPEEADRIRDIAVRAEHAVRQWGTPFSDGWEHWSPPHDWTVPALPKLT